MPTPTASFPTNLLRISSDPFDNASSQHATEVEPDVVADGSTVVSVFQTGRFFIAGASGIGFATSLNGGRSFRAGVLPDITRVQQPASTFDSASDPTVAFDAAHHVWLAASLPVRNDSGPVPGALVSRSQDGLRWGFPIGVGSKQGLADKSWITCDDTPASPFYGHCYVEWDDASAGGLVRMSTSRDGGRSWSAPAQTLDATTGIGGHPVVQPNGNVVVPMNDFNQTAIIAFRSVDGGATWGTAVRVSDVKDHRAAGLLRTSPLPTAAVDAGGTVYVVWQDCRFHRGCSANDLVMSVSNDGVNWRGPIRIPIDPRGSKVDHFIPGLSADPRTGGSSAHLALAYYFYSDAACAPAACQLNTGFVQSPDAGASWTARVTLAGPMSLGWLPATRDGLMVGDYIATAFSNGVPLGVFAVAGPLGTAPFDEAMYVPKRIEAAIDYRHLRRAFSERPEPGVTSDHPPRRPRPRDLE